MLLDSSNFFGGGGPKPVEQGMPDDLEQTESTETAAPKKAKNQPGRETIRQGFSRRLFSPGRSSANNLGVNKQTAGELFKKGPSQMLQDKALDKASNYTKDKAAQLWDKSGGADRVNDIFKKLDGKTRGAASKIRNATSKHLGDVNALANGDTEELKKRANDYLQDEGKKEIKKVVEKGVNRAFGRTAGNVASEGAVTGAEGAAEGAALGTAEGAAIAGSEGAAIVAGEVGAEVAVEAGVATTVELAGAAGDFIAPGISTIIATLIVIAISLGISDAIDGLAAFAKGDRAEAIHDIIRGITKVVVFVVALIMIIVLVAILNIIGLGISLLVLNLYWASQAIPFVKDLAIMQGLVWWEKILIVIMNIVVIIVILLGTVVGLYAVCTAGLYGGYAAGGIAGGAAGLAIQQAPFCQAFNGPLAANSGTPGTTTDSTTTNGSSNVPAGEWPPAGMVEMKTVDPRVKLDMRYATANNFIGRVLYPEAKCYLKSNIANAVKAAQTELEKQKPGYHLKIWDCYRPPSVQQAMVDWANKVGHPEYIGHQIGAVNSGKHPQGLAIDLTIEDANGNNLTMPSDFDDFNGKGAGSNSNSQLLADVMKAGSLNRISTEWWHFN